MAGNELKNNESVWKKLTRLFRSTPSIRHKIAIAEPVKDPIGTARAFKRDLTTLNHQWGSSVYERSSKLADYAEMVSFPEISKALDVLADDVTAENEHGQVIEIVSDNIKIKNILNSLFYDVLNIEHNYWSWTRNSCKYGDYLLCVDASEENGILNLLPVPINEIEREEGFDKNDPFSVRFKWVTQNKVFEAWQIIHFRLMGEDENLPWGSSVLESARRIWRQLILVEDAMLAHRMTRAADRRVFYIDVGNVPPTEVPQFLEEVRSRMNVKVTDSSNGRIDQRYSPQAIQEDLWVPVREGRSTRVESLQGGQFQGVIDDVNYLQNKLFAALGVPKAFLTYSDNLAGKATLASEDVRFSRTVSRIQKVMISELYKIATIHLFLIGYRGQDLVDYIIKPANSSTIAQQQKLELWRQKFEIASIAQEGMLDRRTVYKKIFGLSDKDIEQIREGKRLDQLEDLMLQAMQAPIDGQTAIPEQTTAEEIPGEDQLATTLGGDVPAEQAQEAPPAEQQQQEIPQESVDPVLHPKRHFKQRPNDGSLGNRSEIAVDKGKDLFSTGEDQYELVFGTQAASDTGDMRSLRRFVTRPFGEVSTPKMPVINKNPDFADTRLTESIEKVNKIDEDVRKYLSKLVNIIDAESIKEQRNALREERKLKLQEREDENS